MQPAPDSTVAAVVAPPERADEIFLEGPRSRFAEFCTLLRIMRDFLRGYRALHFVGPCVTVFGSARIKPDDPHYELALKMGAAIARLGFTVMTGGGPGIMEAANRGAVLVSFQLKNYKTKDGGLVKVVGGKEHLAYQVAKYQQRNGWSHRDLLRLRRTDPVLARRAGGAGHPARRRREL